MKISNICKLVALIFGTAIVATGCIQETFPMGGSATKEQVGESTFAADGMMSAIPSILVSNIILNDHSDFGYPSLMVNLDHAIGEIIPTVYSANGNPYYDRFLRFTYHNNLGPTNGWCAQFWYHYYQFIKLTNDMISVCGDSELLKEQRGVSKTFRALYYLDMARLYDPLYAVSTERPEYQASLAVVEGLTVPLIDENTTEDAAKNNPRLPREQMFQFIFNDLNDAEYCLKDYAPASKNQPTLAVVYGLKARAYLWLGGFEEGKYDLTQYPDVLTGNAAYKKAAEYARLAITKSGCKPLTEAEYCDKKLGFNKANNAWMWCMIQSTDTILATLYTWAAHMCTEGSWSYGSCTRLGVRKETYERMSNTDFRKKLIVGPSAKYEDYKDVTNLTASEWASWGDEGLPMSPYAHLKFRTNSGERHNSSTGNVVDIPLMRVEEMYLIEAEATAHYDETTGRELIKSFMTTRDPNYKIPVGIAGESFIEEIIFQKRCELWGEGILFYDYKRLDMGVNNAYEGHNACPGMDFYSEGRFPIWNLCIPIEEVQQNNALVGKNNPDPSLTLKPKSQE